MFCSASCTEMGYLPSRRSSWVTSVIESAMIVPPIPAFYNRPATVDDIINHSVGKALDLLDIPHALFARWKEGTEHGTVRSVGGGS